MFSSLIQLYIIAKLLKKSMNIINGYKNLEHTIPKISGNNLKQHNKLNTIIKKIEPN